MKYILWLLSIILMALFSLKVYPTNITTYELIVDFGNDYAFRDTGYYLSLKKCEKRLRELKEEIKDDKVKLFCIKRG